MFDNSGFYPTPRKLMPKLLSRMKVEYANQSYLTKGTWLEPQAGKGDIVDYLVDVHRVHKSKVFCIEQDPNLRHILTSKGYKVIDSDFLAYDGAYRFDRIIMNPPFDSGDKHLLKAWDVMRSGKIACVLNAETIRNPHTRTRQLLLEIIQKYGEYEFAGRPFANAERPTDVEVVLVWLEKPEPKTSFDFDGGGFDRDGVVDEATFQANPLAHANIIDSLVAQYNRARDVLIEKSKLEAEYRFYISGVVDTKWEDEKAGQTLNEELDDLKKRFWNYVFEKTNLGKMTTSDFQRKFSEFQEQQRQMAFTAHNIKEMLAMFFLNRDTIMEDCLSNVFDTATAYHAKNKVHTEGWKTNKSWKVNKKIIIPNALSQEFGWRFSYYSTAGEFVRDIDKVLCYIDGRSIESITTAATVLEERFNKLNRSGGDYMEEIESTNFRMRFYKKGTLHLTFKDEDLWNQFNIKAAENKNWVGAGY